MEMERLLQVSWNDAGMHADMKDLVLKKIISSPIWQYFRFKANENGEPRDSNKVMGRACRKQVMTKQSNTTTLCDIHTCYELNILQWQNKLSVLPCARTKEHHTHHICATQLIKLAK